MVRDRNARRPLRRGASAPPVVPILLAVAAAVLVAAPGGAVRAQGYGVPVDSYPGWQDRALEVVINACRMAPQDFRDLYLQYPDILQPAYYPPVAPLVWCEDLNRAARFHSEDIASCDFVSHSSCDGTTMSDRIHGFYPYTVWIGEVMAFGWTLSPFGAVVLWLEDSGEADGSGLDGHRQNVMRAQFTEGGGGWCYDPASSWRNYYTYDFGGRDLGDPPALVDGAHLFLAPDTTSFWANWYAPASDAPQQARVYVDGLPHVLAVHLGGATAGTWSVDLPVATACRSYVFLFVDAGGAAHWYPAAGSLRTWGEGGCTADYLAGPTGVPVAARGSAVFESIAPNPFNPATTIRFRLDGPGDVRLTVVDLRGRLVRTLLVAPVGAGSHAVAWDGRDDAGRSVGAGVYCVRLGDGTGRVQVAKVTVVK